MTERVNKAGTSPDIASQDLHRWVSIWVRHGRSRLRTFELFTKAHGLLDSLKRLRDLLASLQGRTDAEAVAFKAQIDDVVTTTDEAFRLLADEISRHADSLSHERTHR